MIALKVTSHHSQGATVWQALQTRPLTVRTAVAQLENTLSEEMERQRRIQQHAEDAIWWEPFQKGPFSTGVELVQNFFSPPNSGPAQINWFGTKKNRAFFALNWKLKWTCHYSAGWKMQMRKSKWKIVIFLIQTQAAESHPVPVESTKVPCT